MTTTTSKTCNPSGKKESVLITGGSGFIGRYLTSRLLEKGYDVSHLSRKANLFGKVRIYRWNPGQNFIDPSAMGNIDYIIHLAGENIGSKRWTRKRKKEIIASRIDSARLLYKTVSEYRIPLKAFITASATGYYGSVTSAEIFEEEHNPADDFTGEVCRMWEEAAGLFEKSGIRTVKIRTAVVLGNNSEIIRKLSSAAKYGVFPVLGSGRQYFPWIHVADLCRIYIRAVEDKNFTGAYNACSPRHITFREFLTTFRARTAKHGIMFRVPSFILRLVYGKMADILIHGSRVNPSRLLSAGFAFDFPGIEDALNDILLSNGR